MVATEDPAMAEREDRCGECEDWFLDRGTPHLIADYRATTDVFTRALPVLTLVFLVSVSGAGNLEWSWAANTAAIVGGFVVLLGIWAAANRLRGRPMGQRPDQIGTVELAIFVLAPTTLQVLFGGQVRAALGTMVALLILLGVIYVVTSYGLIPMTRFALVETFTQLRAVLGLVVRALPLLLLVNAFLFINAEMWQVADGLTGATLAAVFCLFVGLAAVFLVIRLPAEVDRLAEETPRPDLTEHTPAEGLACDLVDGLGRTERVNLLLVLLFSQVLQVAIVSVLIGGFFVAFGLIAVAPDVIEAWIGTTGHVLAEFTLFGNPVVVTAELLTVAAFLSAFSGLYFTVQVVTDGTYREEFFEELLDEIRTTLAVRSAYRTMLAATSVGSTHREH
ncbi:MAG TPA: hypothetical protein VMW08_11685 [Acidimicrobiales bacterium]|nr:hypothetical protein [Acidimicrobiales bacterium]